MICKNCDAEIENGKLYCEKCGEDIHYVPDYEPELEHSLKETMSNLMEKFIKEEDLDDELDQQFEDAEVTFRFDKIVNTKLFFISCGIVLLCIIGSGLYIIGSINKKNSYEHLLEEGMKYLENGNLEEASKYLEKVTIYDNGNLELKFLLADTYYQNNKVDNAVNLLLEIIYTGDNGENLTAEILEDAYRKLFTIYEEESRFDNIYVSLQNCNSQAILTEYKHYNIEDPKFSLEEGVYNIEMPLKLSTSIAGEIYYTTDGTQPTLYSKKYEEPIFLEKGAYKVCALFINAYGIESEVVSAEYSIEILSTDAPRVYTPSGTYTKSTLIEVDLIEGINIFYTSNGDEPDETANLYVEPIVMPLGKSEFRFIGISENNVKSEIVLCNYEWVVTPTYTEEESLYQLLEKFVVQEKIRDFYGNSHLIEGQYQYISEGIISIHNVGEFYVFKERIAETDGTQNETGNSYAVSIYTRQCYTLQYVGNGVYNLGEI